MNIDQLLKLTDDNGIALKSPNGKRIPPYYYLLLRNSFGFYFNTFNTNQTWYANYAEGLSETHSRDFGRPVLDEENTMFTILGFQHFFEIFIKEFLIKIHPSLILKAKEKYDGTLDLVQKIQTGTMGFGTDYLAFNGSLTRLYDLIGYSKDEILIEANPLIKDFSENFKGYEFLGQDDCKSSLEYLNTWRNILLHKSDRLPSMWLLDYLVTQRWMPIIFNIFIAEKELLGESLFYFKTVTEIDLIAEFARVKFDFDDLKDDKKKNEVFWKLLYIGHLKELGRANLNMNLFVRKGIQATYEYNYRDTLGRGKRFAYAEQEHEHFTSVSICPCCKVDSLINYRETYKDVLRDNKISHVDWVKCCTCDYHLSHHVGSYNSVKTQFEKLLLS